MKKIVCVIPARLASTRFSEKMLSILGTKPLLQWVWEAANRCVQFDDVLFATDDQKICNLIETFHGKYVMTSTKCQSGTERLVEVMQRGVLNGDIWVNWQGDEPFISQEMITDLLQSIEQDGEIWTLKKKITDPGEIGNPNTVKVVVNAQDEALYFSRAHIPYQGSECYKHIGLYAYSKQALKTIANLPPSSLERTENLEQLRFLEGGMKIQVYKTDIETVGIDLLEDLIYAERLLSITH